VSTTGTIRASTARAGLCALAFFALESCGGKDVVVRDAAGPTTTAPIPAVAPGAAPTAPLHAASPARSIPAIGGCNDDCADARTAVTRFLDATARADGTQAAARFLDSTRLVLDGRALGERWAGLWRDLKSATRRDEMDEVLRDLAQWTTGLSPAQVRDALTAGPKSVRNWSTEAEFEFQPPGAPPWTLVFAPRGVEWLLIEVRRGREETP
jgi:hypothetical protein